MLFHEHHLLSSRMTTERPVSIFIHSAISSCSSALTFNPGDLVFSPELEFCETRPEPFADSRKLTHPLEEVFSTLPLPTTDLNIYSIGTVRKKILSSVQLELDGSPKVNSMTLQDLHAVTNPFSEYYTTISPSKRRVAADYMPMRTAFCVSQFSMTILLASSSTSATFLAIKATFLQAYSTFLPWYSASVSSQCFYSGG